MPPVVIMVCVFSRGMGNIYYYVVLGLLSVRRCWSKGVPGCLRPESSFLAAFTCQGKKSVTVIIMGCRKGDQDAVSASIVGCG